MAAQPLTVPVALTIQSALEELRTAAYLDGEEALLLERLTAAKSDAERKAALLQAIEDAPTDAD